MCIHLIQANNMVFQIFGNKQNAKTIITSRITNGDVLFQKAMSKFSSMLRKLKTAAKHFADPVLLMLCLAGSIRNGAGLVWAYNIVLFFGEYWPEVNVSI